MITRCTTDIRSVDSQLPDMLYWVMDTVFNMFTKLAVIVLLTPAFLLPGVAVGVIGWFMGDLYLKTQLCVKREMRHGRVVYSSLQSLILVTATPALPCLHTLAQLSMALVRKCSTKKSMANIIQCLFVPTVHKTHSKTSVFGESITILLPLAHRGMSIAGLDFVLTFSALFLHLPLLLILSMGLSSVLLIRAYPSTWQSRSL